MYLKYYRFKLVYSEISDNHHTRRNLRNPKYFPASPQDEMLLIDPS